MPMMKRPKRAKDASCRLLRFVGFPSAATNAASYSHLMRMCRDCWPHNVFA